METSFANCKRIFDTLPVGYYTGRRMGVVLDEHEPTSYYNMMEDSIVISYPIIAERMKHASENCNEEEAVRSMLYHEVSHALLTPRNMDLNWKTNCVEDERIESLLRHHYHGVDFRQQLYDIHGGYAPKATDVQSAFFNAVRFGLGTAKVQEKVNDVLKKSSKLYPNSCWSDCYHYEQQIEELYNLICKEFKKDPDAFQDGQEGNDGKGQPKDMDNVTGNGKNGEDGKNSEKSGNGNPSEGKEEGKGNDTEGQGAKDGEEQNASEGNAFEGKPHHGEAHNFDMSEEQLKRIAEKIVDESLYLDEDEKKKLEEFRKTAELIIGNFNKKNSGGSGINAYSGVFNPRCVTRQDYRFFERSMTTQGNNRFGTCHLNLIIDRSGSFCGSQNITNGILKILTEIERKNRNFSMDVSFIGTTLTTCQTVRQRQLYAMGGNDVPRNMKEILLKMQKPQTCNYNIILFDGDAFSNCSANYDEKCRRFGAFDMKQTTLITDEQNEPYMTPSFSSTNVVVTKEYTAELIDHIIRAFTIAFG